MPRQSTYHLPTVFTEALRRPSNQASYMIKLGYLFKIPGQYASEAIRETFGDSGPAKAAISRFITGKTPNLTTEFERRLRVLCDHADSQFSKKDRSVIYQGLLNANDQLPEEEEFYPGERKKILREFKAYADPGSVLNPKTGRDLVLLPSLLEQLGFEPIEVQLLSLPVNFDRTVNVINTHSEDTTALVNKLSATLDKARLELTGSLMERTAE